MPKPFNKMQRKKEIDYQVQLAIEYYLDRSTDVPIDNSENEITNVSDKTVLETGQNQGDLETENIGLPEI